MPILYQVDRIRDGRSFTTRRVVAVQHGQPIFNLASWLDPQLMGASLDHAMWFHRPFRADEWLLYDQESPSAQGSRGLGQGRIYTRGGTHVVSVVQEGLFRRRRSAGSPEASATYRPAAS